MPRFSGGWLGAFKRRYKIQKFRFHGDERKIQLSKIQDILVDYERKDIYNMDGTGLYWKRAPIFTLATEQPEGV